jgi:hypothetical protein
MYEDERLSVLQQHNRALRIVHRQLRKALKYTVEYNDNLFLELCNSDPEAGLAMEKLWTLGGMQDICGPRDYDKIVEVCLSKMNVTSPIDHS